MSYFFNRETAHKLLEEHVKDDYQQMHAKMVATCLEAYAIKLGEDKDLWYITGLLHDLDYFEHPESHPEESLKWFKKWKFPEEMIHAVSAHSTKKPRLAIKSKLDAALIAIDELTGFLYAYSLMRPTGFEGMKPKSVKKKFKDKAFAAKIDRKEIEYGIESFETDFAEHTQFVIEVLKTLL